LNAASLPPGAIEESCLGWYGGIIFKVFQELIPEGEGLRFFLDCEHYGRYGLELAARRPHCQVVMAQILPCTGLESWRAAAQIANMRGLTNVKFLVASAHGLPFRYGSFDAAATFQAEELDDSISLFAELTRIVKPGGKVVATMPNRRCAPHRLTRWLSGAKRDKPPLLLTPEEIRDRLERCGLQNIQVMGRCFMQSFMRLGSTGPLPGIFRALRVWTLGRWIETHLVSRLDRWTGNRFSNRYGFEIIAAGSRPREMNKVAKLSMQNCQR
jgi:SAM-dependent methyltransferase